MKFLLYILISLLYIGCAETSPAGPDWGDVKPEPKPEPESPTIEIKMIEPSTALADEGADINGLRFYPGISINIAAKNFNSSLASIAAAGFKYIEITIKHSFGFNTITDQRAKEILTEQYKLVKNNGLTVWSIHLPFEDPTWTNIAGEETIRVQIVDNIMRVLRLCTESIPECKNYVLHASKGTLSPRSESVAQARKSLAEMLPVAKELGVRLCVENLVGSLCYSIAEMNATIEGFEDAWVTYDIGHAHCVGIDVVEFLKAIGPRLGTVHIQDTMFNSKNDSHSLIGKGDISKWEEVYRTMLIDNRYRGVFLFELSGANPHTVMASYNKIIDDYKLKYNE